MITPTLRKIFGFSILLFIAHGIEEFLTHFRVENVGDQMIFGGLFGNLSTHSATFVTFQLMFWLLLILSFILLLGERWQFRVLAIAGVVYVYELHHLIKAIQIGEYYSGLVTALVFPLIAVFFWKEWFRVYKSNK